MDRLARLKLLTDERDETNACSDCGANDTLRLFTDEELIDMLGTHDGDVNATAYDVLLRKAQHTNDTLGGVTTADQAGYYLRLAAAVRQNMGRAVPRADGRLG